jgi:phthalate 4,5-cis-dihydrodiol dehydrogenase
VSLPIPARSWQPGRGDVLQELVEAAAGRPVVHDGAFGRETVRVCLAVAQSAREHREVVLAPSVDAAPVCSASGR